MSNKEIERFNRLLFETSYSNLIAKEQDKTVKYVQRFEAFPRLLHFTMIISFLTLAVSGMSLKFSTQPWAVTISGLVGGYENLGIFHRIAATALFTIFFLHFIYVYKKWKKWQESSKGVLNYIYNKDSVLPHRNDAKELFGAVKWFFGLGPQPNFGRWTYWEKFDYFAIAWGMVIIGGTGLTLWFPEFFTRWIPGYWLNIATIIHSDEALLAASFIFTIHFFNTHFRPEKFPLDPVIFTGQVPLEEFKHERPREYEQKVKDGKLMEILSDEPAPRWLRIGARIFGFAALTVGISLIVGIVYSMIFLYK